MSSDIDEKVGVHLYIEKELLQKARDKCLNLSAFLRKKLKEELGEEYEAF
ncbi:MAG: type II toxin-antitoxin system CcdA family antitoxin [Candidatus Hodarchaeota archaeon]